MQFDWFMKFAGLNVVVFCLFMGIAYLINPSEASDKEKARGSGSVDFVGQKYNPDLYGPDAVARLQKEIAGLEQAIEEYRQGEARYNAIIDSLQKVVLATEARAEETLTKNETIKESAAIANSLLELDEDALSAILTRLDDRQLMVIYKAAGKLQQGKLLRSLDPDRAAKLLKEVIS